MGKIGPRAAIFRTLYRVAGKIDGQVMMATHLRRITREKTPARRPKVDKRVRFSVYADLLNPTGVQHGWGLDTPSGIILERSVIHDLPNRDSEMFRSRSPIRNRPTGSVAHVCRKSLFRHQ